MPDASYAVIDCDGHIVESVAEMADYMDARTRRHALQGSRNRQGVFPSIDGFHFALHDDSQTERRRTASNARPGSAADWIAFLDQAKIDRTVLFTSEGLSVGLIQSPRYAGAVCRAYNDYVHDRFARVDARLRPMALIPMQDPEAAAAELRRAVRDLGLPGAMVPSTGLPVHLGHSLYWPVYKAAAELDCVLGVHGGSNYGSGLDTFSNFTASHVLHHSIPLMTALVSFIYHGVYDRFPGVRFAFMEGGCGWLAFLLDRMERDANYFDAADQPRLRADKYLHDGRILVGCEGSEKSLAYVASRIGIGAFAYASDYPHEVDLPAAIHEIDEVAERPDLSSAEKQAVLGDNARRFFRL
ncbi:MAG TPA: amidohydrolase family protein [Stellaceae bacterium]|nr:amidohydrolase family protein [Stellaceae bacterium]